MTTKPLGPTFASEIIAAGLSGLPFSWGADGDIQGRANLTADQSTTLDAVIAAHDATKLTPALLIAAGLQIASASTPALNGTYAIDPASQGQITGEALYIQVTTGQGAARFTNGQATKAWIDASGGAHVFTTAQFISFAEAVAEYVDAVIAGSRPPQPVSIP
jgi:hypothetical protein